MNHINCQPLTLEFIRGILFNHLQGFSEKQNKTKKHNDRPEISLCTEKDRYSQKERKLAGILIQVLGQL